jgi:hypothetical protein
MGVALFAIEEAAHAELARQRPVDRFVQQQVARQVRAEAAVGLDLLGQFAVDALEVAGSGLTWRLFFRVMCCSGYFLLPTVNGRLRPPLLMHCVAGLLVSGMPTMASQVSCSLTTSTGLP